jgi:hypothetical protein
MFFKVNPCRKWSLRNFLARAAIWNILDYDFNTRDCNLLRFASYGSDVFADGKSHVGPFSLPCLQAGTYRLIEISRACSRVFATS